MQSNKRPQRISTKYPEMKKCFMEVNREICRSDGIQKGPVKAKKSYQIINTHSYSSKTSDVFHHEIRASFLPFLSFLLIHFLF